MIRPVHTRDGEDLAAQAARLDPTDACLLALVICLPLAPLSVLAPFLPCSTGTTHRRLRRLCDQGMLSVISTPLRARGRPARLLLPTDLGPAILARRGSRERPGPVERFGLRRTSPTRLLQELPPLLAAYDLLALLAAAGSGRPRLDAWERPWRRTLPPSTRAGDAVLRAVRLPAAATLTWSGPDGPISKQYLLVPDTGGLALPAMRATLGRLAEHQAARAVPATLVIATTTSRRATAWAALLEAVCQTRRLPLMEAQVTTWAVLRHAARAPDQQHRGQQALLGIPHPLAVISASSSAAAPPRVSGRTSPTARPHRVVQVERSADPGPVLGPLDRAVLDLVGRHPFLPMDSVAAVLGRDIRWALARRARLAARGLLRVVPAAEVTPPELARRGLLELTEQGLGVLAAQLGLPVGAAVRHHGLAGGGPASPVGPRAALLGHLPHTLGADAIFAGLARAARAHPGGGALLEWRRAAACAHGRLRPDGYGLLCLGGQRHGFFLEFDRGSMRPGRLRAKFLAYHRYRTSARAEREYQGFPTILVVTTAPGAEKRLADAVRAADAGQALPLPLLLTTRGWIDTHERGALGAVWRGCQSYGRRAWPAGNRVW